MRIYVYQYWNRSSTICHMQGMWKISVTDQNLRGLRVLYAYQSQSGAGRMSSGVMGSVPTSAGTGIWARLRTTGPAQFDAGGVSNGDWPVSPRTLKCAGPLFDASA